MKTIFFPYTYIDRSTLDRINKAFGPVAILQPARNGPSPMNTADNRNVFKSSLFQMTMIMI